MEGEAKYNTGGSIICTVSSNIIEMTKFRMMELVAHGRNEKFIYISLRVPKRIIYVQEIRQGAYIILKCILMCRVRACELDSNGSGSDSSQTFTNTVNNFCIP